MKKIILDLCGGTGSWSNPYKEKGYDVSQIEDLVNGTKFSLDSENLKKFLGFEEYEIHG